jgi:hypothetical protein
MNLIATTDRRAPHRHDRAEALSYFFHAPGVEGFIVEDMPNKPEWGDFESPLEEEAFWRIHA